MCQNVNDHALQLRPLSFVVLADQPVEGALLQQFHEHQVARLEGAQMSRYDGEACQLALNRALIPQLGDEKTYRLIQETELS